MSGIADGCVWVCGCVGVGAGVRARTFVVLMHWTGCLPWMACVALDCVVLCWVLCVCVCAHVRACIRVSASACAC